MTLLEQAARCDDFQWALTALVVSLKITDTATAYAILPDPDTWRRMPVEMRLIELASWLHAECFEVIHQIDGATNGYAGPQCRGVRVVQASNDHHGR